MSVPEREKLRETFDKVADRYDKARPEYPAALFDDLIALAGLVPGADLLEVGCATGIATRRFAEKGFRVTCVELGAALAEAARANLAEYGVDVLHGRFEDFPGVASFDLVYAATAWHWVDPAIRYQRTWQALRAGGHLAFWSALHVFPDDGDPIFAQLHRVYAEIGEARPGEGTPRPGELPEHRAEIEASGLFTVLAVRHYDWETEYTADQYIELISTFSGHIAMAGWQRDRLYGEVRRLLAQRPSGTLRRHWGAALHVARRRDRPA